MQHDLETVYVSRELKRSSHLSRHLCQHEKTWNVGWWSWKYFRNCSSKAYHQTGRRMVYRGRLERYFVRLQPIWSFIAIIHIYASNHTTDRHLKSSNFIFLLRFLYRWRETTNGNGTNILSQTSICKLLKSIFSIFTIVKN